MAEAVELAMRTIGDSVAALPDPNERDFTQLAAPILANLRKLEGIAADAAKSTRGTPAVVLALNNARRSYDSLMLRAAKSPSATSEQRLYGARQCAELSVDPPDAVAAISALIAQLAAG